MAARFKVVAVAGFLSNADGWRLWIPVFAGTTTQLIPRLLFVQPGVTLLVQPVEFFLLLIDAVGYPRFVLLARSASCLFDQLPDVVLKDRDPIVEFCQR